MTTCADSTRLRTHLDHPDPGLDEHLDGCPACTGLLHAVAADAGYARRALAVLDAEADAGVAAPDVERALAAVRTAPVRPPAPVDDLDRGRPTRWAAAGRRLALSGAAAVLVVAVLITPAGRGALADALDAFRGQRLQVVTVDPQAWASTLDGDDARRLEALGDLDTRGLIEPDLVAGAAEAEALARIAAPAVGDRPDRYVAMPPSTARFVLRARPGNGVPAELDGAALVVDVPGVIGAVYGPPRGAPQAVVARSGPLVVRSEGASLDAVRSFLLDRDELPADLRRQLAAIDDWRTTVPVPVPVDSPGWREVDVAGRPAIAFGDASGLGAVVVRQDPDGVTLVGGRLTVDRALELAGRA